VSRKDKESFCRENEKTFFISFSELCKKEIKKVFSLIPPLLGFKVVYPWFLSFFALANFDSNSKEKGGGREGLRRWLAVYESAQHVDKG
jgi:hypothetical protein